MNHIHGPEQEHHHVALDVPLSSLQLDENWIRSMKERAEGVRQRLNKPTLTIGRVPRSICMVDPEAYEPRMVSLGPYHRGKPHLQAMEELKWHYLSDFLLRNPDRSLEEYLKQLTSVAARASSSYSEELKTMNTNEIVEMLLLDSCFVVELFLKRSLKRQEDRRDSREYEDPIRSTEFALTLVVVDMLMLENQLPFFVLELLYETVPASTFFADFAYTELPGKKSFAEFALARLNLDGGFPMNEALPEGSTFHHLLHLFYSSVVPKDCSKQRIPEELTHPKSLFSELWRRCPVPLGRHHPPPEQRKDSIPCATKLKEAGIKFKIKDATSFLDITFDNGCIEMPQIGVYDFTRYLLRNVIAFEQCHRLDNRPVATYAALLGCMIETPGDVELLHKKGVIVNALGNAAYAAGMFNNLCRDVSADFDDTYLLRFVEDVNRHSSSKMNKWTFKLHHVYFNNPWSIVSFCAAGALLLLTLLQTIFTILPYARPRN